jgi:hypothetical protein
VTAEPNPDPLDELLAASGLGGNVLTSEDIGKLWEQIAPDQVPTEFLRAVAQACSPEWDDDTVAADRLGLRLGRWRIDLTRQGVRAGLLTAVAAAALAQHGLTDLGVVFATAVLPAVFDIQRVELSAGDRKLLVELRAKDALTRGYVSTEELYDSLPAATRRQINPYDFADFVERLRATGLTDGARDGTVRLLGSGEHGPLIGL